MFNKSCVLEKNSYFWSHSCIFSIIVLLLFLSFPSFCCSFVTRYSSNLFFRSSTRLLTIRILRFFMASSIFWLHIIYNLWYKVEKYEIGKFLKRSWKAFDNFKLQKDFSNFHQYLPIEFFEVLDFSNYTQVNSISSNYLVGKYHQLMFEAEPVRNNYTFFSPRKYNHWRH